MNYQEITQIGKKAIAIGVIIGFLAAGVGIAGCVREGTHDGGIISDVTITPNPYANTNEKPVATASMDLVANFDNRYGDAFANGYNGCSLDFDGSQKTIWQGDSRCIVKNSTNLYCVQDPKTTSRTDFMHFVRGCQAGRGTANVAYEGANYDDIVNAYYFRYEGDPNTLSMHHSEYHIQKNIPDFFANSD